MDHPSANSQGTVWIVEVDSSVYPVEVVHKSLYWLRNRVRGEVERSDDGARLSIALKPNSETENEETLRGDLFALLTDFSVRHQVDRETRAIRELIFTKALAASTALRDSVPGDDRDPIERHREKPDGF